jgi:uncharacterized protein YndB with AHSA1/START domain
MPPTHGTFPEPLTFRIQRLLPGPIERVWAYLVDSDLRRQWLAAGEMEARLGAEVELVWRNDDLTDPPGRRPEGFAAEHRMTCQVTACDPPRRLAITWGRSEGVTFDLEEADAQVLLTVTHRKLPDRDMALMVSAGWHAHLDVLVARMSGEGARDFWGKWVRLKGEYGAVIG